MRLLPATLLCSLTLFLPPAAEAQKDSGWIATWACAAMPHTGTDGSALHMGNQDVTLRQVVHISQGGKRLRIAFSNEFGSTPLHIAAAHVAFLAAGSKILTATDRALAFSGHPDLTIAPGQFAYSDPVTETVPIFSDLVITLAIPRQPLPTLTYHALAMATTWMAPGQDVTAAAFELPSASPAGVQPPDVAAPVRSLSSGESPVREPIIVPQPGQETKEQPASGSTKTTSWYFLKDVEVNRGRHAAAIVAFGDSITDGAHSTPETNRRWPDLLASLLAEKKHTAQVAVLNAGISGNRLLKFGEGPSAMDRFDRDVLQQTGAKYVVLLEGINDLGEMHRSPADAVTERQLLAAYTALAKLAHAAGLKVIAGTLTPYEGARYYSEDGEQMRERINGFLRSDRAFDAVIDFDRVIADPRHPHRLAPKYDSGDHLHPSDAGYAAIAAGIHWNRLP